MRDLRQKFPIEDQRQILVTLSTHATMLGKLTSSKKINIMTVTKVY